MMPEDKRLATLSEKQLWRYAPLGEVCATSAGGTPLKLHSANYDGGTIPWLMSGEVGQRDVIAASKFITDIGLANSSAKLFPPSSVLVAMYGATAGDVGILRFQAATNQAVCAILPSEAFSPEFLYYFLLSQKKKLVATATGNAQPNISQAKIRALELPVTPRDKQERIVSILDEAFEAIDAAKANAQKNLQAADTLFETYRDEVFSSSDATSYIRLRQLAAFRNGVNFTKSSKGNTLQIIGVGDFQDNFIIPTEDLDSVTIDGEVNEDDLLRSGDLLTVRSNGNVELIGRTMVVDKCPPNTLHSGFTIRTRLLRKDVCPKYVCHFMRSSRTRRQMIEGGTGVNIKSLNQGTLGDLVVPLPPTNQQIAIAANMDELSIETQRLEQSYRQKLGTLEDLKESLLHQAFSGNL